MKSLNQHKQFLTGAVAVLAGTLAIAGCNTNAAHPDDKSQVNAALSNNNLSNISVSQDRDKGVITLTGNVNSQDQKTQAETLAQQAAPGYTVADEIGVQTLRRRRAGQGSRLKPR